jgi:hypothetical protein
MTSNLAQLSLATPSPDLMLLPLQEVQVCAFLVLALLFWLFHGAHYNYNKFCMCLSYLNICCQFISCVKITIADLFVMLLVFGFRTRSWGMSFSRDCVVLVYILFLSPFLLFHNLISNKHLFSTVISFAILVNKLKQVCTSILVIPLTKSLPLF